MGPNPLTDPPTPHFLILSCSTSRIHSSLFFPESISCQLFCPSFPSDSHPFHPLPSRNILSPAPLPPSPIATPLHSTQSCWVNPCARLYTMVAVRRLGEAPGMLDFCDITKRFQSAHRFLPQTVPLRLPTAKWTKRRRQALERATQRGPGGVRGPLGSPH